MKKVVISGSSKLQEKVQKWLHYFEKNGFQVLDYPKYVAPEEYSEKLPGIYEHFYASLDQADVLFVMNEEKNNVKGYIGASAIAELTYMVMKQIIHHKKIDIYLLTMPSEEQSCYEEIKFWLDHGWVKLFDQP